MPINILDTYKYYRGLPGQVEAARYLDSILTEDEKTHFSQLYRDNPPTQPQQAPPTVDMTMTFHGTYIYGFREFDLALTNNGKSVDRVSVLSGAGSTQTEPFVLPSKDYPGSLRCLPEGYYEVGPVEDAGAGQSWGEGLGRYVIELKPLSNVGGRSAFFIHVDANKSYSPGSAGCPCPFNDKDIFKVMGWLNQKAKPELLICDLGLGSLGDLP
jgi:hypothetical protein